MQTIQQFKSIFRESGHSARFEGCTAKNGDICNGEYKVEGNKLYFTYTDKNGMQYDSEEMPTRFIIL